MKCQTKSYANSVGMNMKVNYRELVLNVMVQYSPRNQAREFGL